MLKGKEFSWSFTGIFFFYFNHEWSSRKKLIGSILITSGVLKKQLLDLNPNHLEHDALSTGHPTEWAGVFPNRLQKTVWKALLVFQKPVSLKRWCAPCLSCGRACWRFWDAGGIYMFKLSRPAFPKWTWAGSLCWSCPCEWKHWYRLCVFIQEMLSTG